MQEYKAEEKKAAARICIPRIHENIDNINSFLFILFGISFLLPFQYFDSSAAHLISVSCVFKIKHFSGGCLCLR